MHNKTTEELLLAWGKWANDNQDQLGCKSPSYELMKLAPHQDRDDRPRTSVATIHISDDLALMIDKAVGKLARHSVLLWSLICKRYQYGMSEAKIARDHKTTAYKIKSMIERAMGVIEGWLIAQGLTSLND